MISILVVNEQRYPVDNAEVTIYWEAGGASTQRTGQSGQTVFSNLGTVNRICVYDEVKVTGPVNYNGSVNHTLTTNK